MEPLTEELLKDLLSEEWLVKVDNIKSIPYLIKFHHSSMDLSSMVLITDTKSVWAEVLDGKQFARRWRFLNSNSPAPYDDQGDEDAWRESSLELLSNAHTLGAISEMPFEVVDSNFSDFAFELSSSNLGFKWRWETNSVGHKHAAEILSKQLIMPLISLNHIAISSPDALSGMADSELEQAVDKVGRTGRRAPHNHVKNVLSKTRTATMLRRITAVFNLIPNLPPIFSIAEKPDLQPKAVEQPPPIPEQSNPRRSAAAAKSPVKNALRRTRSPSPSPPKVSTPTPVKSASSKGKAPEPEALVDGSETEDETDEETNKPAAKASPPNQSSAKTTKGHDTEMRSPSPTRTTARSNPPSSKRPSPTVDDSDESAPKPTESQKKQKVASSDGSDSDAKPSQPVVRRGARQPVKRGGKRF
ncbi:hypothetical protein FA13DRAFT_1729301 [Coprinellus micaceus]|uniref:XLF-like N-terminal domain-containing protein n=1 Tax=Coprinellus micaceus TaxID=71717 RepID=A0A4Y7TKC6_COPMI|nr:hypothetical protein FA13DRAFT_1729301 [Coprinellus micaceus]